jgi:hypothetical protein
LQARGKSLDGEIFISQVWPAAQPAAQPATQPDFVQEHFLFQNDEKSGV